MCIGGLKNKWLSVGGWLVSSLLSGALVAWLAYISVYRWGPFWQHDYPSYHLPFIVRDFNLSTWELWPNLLPLWEGYPPLGHAVQGLMFWLSGLPTLANAISTVAILLFVPTALVVVPRLEIGWLLIGFFGIPLFLMNYPTGGLDVWFSLGVLIQFMSLVAIISGDKRSYLHEIFIASAAFVMFSKMNGWAIAPFLSCIYGVSQLRQLRRAPVDTACRFMSLAIAIGFWPMRNWIVMGSPAWPIPLPPFSTLGNFAISPVVHPKMFVGVFGPITYLASFFEVTRLLTSEPMRWNFTMWQGGPESPHQMMGGLNGAYMAVLVIFLVFMTWRRTIPKAVFFIWLASVALVSIQIQAYEQRYSLYIPLMLISILLSYSKGNCALVLKFTMLSALVVSCVFCGFDGQLVFDNKYPLMSKFLEIQKFWHEKSIGKTNKNAAEFSKFSCIPGADKQFVYADPLGIYFTGPLLNSINVKLCREECQYPWQVISCAFEW